MLDLSDLLTTEILPTLQNGSAFPGELLYSIYGDAYFSSHRIVWVRILLISLYTVFAVAGVTTNAAVVFFLLIRHRKSLRNITNRFVLALAISDIFMSGFNMPMQAYYEMQERVYFSNITCQLVFSTFGLPMHISCLVILVIGIDRYRIIVYPLRRRMPRRAASFTLLGIVVISVMSVVPIAIFSKSSQAVTKLEDGHRTPMQYHYCVEQWPSPEFRLGYTVFTFTLQFFLPLLLTATLYTRIYFRLHERRFRKRDLERKKRTNKILIAIVICFFICWTPWNIFSIILEVYAYRTQRRNPEVLSGNMTGPIDLKFLLSPSREGGFIFFPESLSGSHRLPRSFQRVYNISDVVPQSRLLLGGHAKLIDLVLKLLAMCSGCLNPCLYGCMTDTMRLLMKRMATRCQKMRDHSVTRLQGSLRGFPEIFNSERSPVKTRGIRKYKRNDYGTSVYNIHCCGFQLIVRTGFHQQKNQVKNMLYPNQKSKSSEGRTSSSTKLPWRIQKVPTNEMTPPSDEMKGLVAESKLTELQATQNPLGMYPMSHNLQQLDPGSITFLHQESATLSLMECSTKRTSLLPSSCYDKTPRSSFMVDPAKPAVEIQPNYTTNDQNFLRVPSITPVVTVCKPTSGDDTEGDREDHIMTNNRHQKLVNIEVYAPPSCLSARPQSADSLRRRSSIKCAPKSCRTLAPLEEVSVAGNPPENTQNQVHKKVKLNDESEIIQKSGESSGFKRDKYKRSVSISLDSDSTKHSESAKKRRSFQVRRQSESFRIKKSPNAPMTEKNSVTNLRDASTESESMISDDFAHFHKIVLQDERLKVNLAPKKPRKSYGTIPGLSTMSAKSHPRKPSIYSPRSNNSCSSKPITSSVTSLHNSGNIVKLTVNPESLIT